MTRQAELFQEFRTAEEARAVFCHQDFLQKIAENRKSAVGKRASLLLERLVVDTRREFYKSTLGVNKGWRRSRLGGHSGSHFYAWWAPKGAPPLRGSAEFEGAPEGAVFLRDIRHHDDHSELHPQSLTECYLPISPRDLRSEEYAPSPLTPVQAQFTSSRQRVRIIKGYPGSGKTTALWHAADLNSQRSTLYVTYSKDLAALAKAHFLRFAPAHKEFHVYTFPRLVRELAGVADFGAAESEARERFLKELSSLPPRVLGPWVDDRKALYDEIHANLIGAALPLEIGRFTACDRPRVPDRIYREQRRKFIGGAAADVVLDVVNTLARRQPEFPELFFPELLLAWKAAGRLCGAKQDGVPAGLLGFDCIAVDEAQDLTPIEALVIARLAAAIRERTRGGQTLLVAGDEAQTVRPTDFEWGWFHDMLHHQVGSPQEFRLGVNLRSPRRIARLINSVWGLYATMAKHERPGGWREAEIEDEASDQLVYCAATPGAEVEQLLRVFADREGLAIISLGDRPPVYVPQDLRGRILTVSEAKGLDFQAVCILDAGESLQKILDTSERVRRDADVEPLSRRLAIDQLRVAVSRPAERIYFLDVATSGRAREQILAFLNWADEGNEIAPAIPAAVLKTLEEELLEPEERVRLCEIDARQFLEVKPEMAWARARQAVSLLGRQGERQAVVDETVRASAWLTLAEVSFSLAMRGTKLAAELGQRDLFEEAALAARFGARPALAETIVLVELLRGGFTLITALELFALVEQHQQELEPWFAMELSTRAPEILKGLEESLAGLAFTDKTVQALPAAYKMYGVVDAAERIAAHRRQAIQKLIGAKLFEQALALVEQDPDASPKLKAECYEGLGKHGEAAEMYRGLGMLKEALRNYRTIPDIGKSLELMRELGGEQAGAASLEWLAELRQVLDKRPPNLARTATAAEKKFLTALLEGQLDGPRVKKTAAKPRAPRKTAAGTAAARKKTKPVSKRNGPRSNPYF
jgi:hypothetical protein